MQLKLALLQASKNTKYYHHGRSTNDAGAASAVARAPLRTTFLARWTLSISQQPPKSHTNLHHRHIRSSNKPSSSAPRDHHRVLFSVYPTSSRALVFMKTFAFFSYFVHAFATERSRTQLSPPPLKSDKRRWCPRSQPPQQQLHHQPLHICHRQPALVRSNYWNWWWCFNSDWGDDKNGGFGTRM